jgi:adenylate cyclase
VVISGAPVARADHAEALADLAIDILDAARNLRDQHGGRVPIRIGVASGPVVGGVIGTRKFFYDVWGDAVNVASRMESTGLAGKIQVSNDTYARLQSRFVFQPRRHNRRKRKGPDGYVVFARTTNPGRNASVLGCTPSKLGSRYAPRVEEIPSPARPD